MTPGAEGERRLLVLWKGREREREQPCSLFLSAAAGAAAAAVEATCCPSLFVFVLFLLLLSRSPWVQDVGAKKVLSSLRVPSLPFLPLSLLPFLLFRGRGNVFLISLRFSAEEREREDESNCCARFSDAATLATAAAAAVEMRAVQWRGSPLAKGKHFRRRRVKKREKTRISHSPLFLLPSWTPFPHVYLCLSVIPLWRLIENGISHATQHWHIVNYSLRVACTHTSSV